MIDRTVPGWVGMLIGLAVGSIAGYGPQLVYLMDVHPGVAGWAQAVGAVVAIFSGFELARQARSQEAARTHARRLSEQHAARSLALALGDVALARSDATLQALKMDSAKTASAAGWMIAQRTVQSDLEVMRAFNLHDLDDRLAMQSFSLLSGLLASTVDMISPLTVRNLDHRAHEVALALDGAQQIHTAIVAVLARLRVCLAEDQI